MRKAPPLSPTATASANVVIEIGKRGKCYRIIKNRFGETCSRWKPFQTTARNKVTHRRRLVVAV